MANSAQGAPRPIVSTAKLASWEFGGRAKAWSGMAAVEQFPTQARFDWRSSLRGRTRFALLLAGVALAYHESFRGLVRGLTLDTPLAYLGLVPLLSAGLSIVLGRRADHGPAIHDRQLDYIVGLPLLGGAVAANVLLPLRLDTYFWLWRIDLLTLPFFVAGACFLLFGTRLTWRMRFPIAFLFATWPFPYTEALFRWTDGFTLLTIRVLAKVVSHVPWASHNPSGDGSRFDIVHQGKVFTVSVASQCAGANGLVGFLLIGSAFCAVLLGPALGKLAWLVVGSIVTWLLNVVRIVLLFGIGSAWGESVAIDGFHPFIGLVLLNAGLVVLLLCVPLFRLHRPGPATAGAAAAPLSDAVKPAAWRWARIVFVAIVAVLAMVNAGVAQYGLVASHLGLPRLAAFTEQPPTLSSWSKPELIARYDWSRRFFGDDSTWNRYAMASPDATAPLWSDTPIIVDVIATSNRSRLETYGVEACYNFHGYDVRDEVEVDLGGGVRGRFLSWQAKKGPRYAMLYWHWPVVENGERRYERVALLLPESSATVVATTAASPVPESAATLGDELAPAASSTSGTSDRLTAQRNFLAEVARTVVRTQPVETLTF